MGVYFLDLQITYQTITEGRQLKANALTRTHRGAEGARATASAATVRAMTNPLSKPANIAPVGMLRLFVFYASATTRCTSRAFISGFAVYFPWVLLT